MTWLLKKSYHNHKLLCWYADQRRVSSRVLWALRLLTHDFQGIVVYFSYCSSGYNLVTFRNTLSVSWMNPGVPYSFFSFHSTFCPRVISSIPIALDISYMLRTPQSISLFSILIVTTLVQAFVISHLDTEVASLLLFLLYQSHCLYSAFHTATSIVFLRQRLDPVTPLPW